MEEGAAGRNKKSKRQTFTLHILYQKCMAMPLDGDQDERKEALFEAIRAQIDLIDEHESCENGLSKVLWEAVNMLFENGVNIPSISDCQKDLNGVAQRSHEQMTSVHHSIVERRWRRLYTDCKLISALLTLKKCSDSRMEDAARDAVLLDSIRDVDMAIIIAGSPGNGRNDLIQRVISCLQNHLCMEYLPHSRQNSTHSRIQTSETICAADADIPLLTMLPDLESYQQKCQSSPFVIRGGVLDWPCFEQTSQSFPSKWADVDHLSRIAGTGRCVPVEIGRNYLDKDWKQDIILWTEFLHRIGWYDDNEYEQEEITYLAQYNLFDQFPKLRSEIILPDLVYSTPSAPAYYPSYKPPIDAEDGMETVLINAWLGPALTVSPPHRDPYYNFYAQVVGSKLVWIAPPEPEIVEAMQIGESTTSDIDVFTNITQSHAFQNNVRPKAMFAILQPGDVLLMPPGWFHAFKALSKSFSVSMWF